MKRDPEFDYARSQGEDERLLGLVVAGICFFGLVVWIACTAPFKWRKAKR